MLLVIALLGAAISLFAANESKLVSDGVNRNGLDYLGYPTNAVVALEKGRADARRDVSNGVFRIPMYGLPAPAATDYWGILKSRYGIQSFGLGGCVVSGGLVSYATGYREVSTAALEAKFGTNILEQAWQEAQKAYQARIAAAAAPERVEPGTHRVKAGETLTRIARQHRVSLNALIAANPRVSPDRLQVNQVLMLPPRVRGE